MLHKSRANNSTTYTGHLLFWQHNRTLLAQEKEGKKAPYNAQIISPFHPQVRNHTQLVFKSLPLPKKKITRPPRQKKPWRKFQSQTPLANKFLCYLIPGVNRNPRKLKLTFGAIQTQSSPEMPQFLLGFWLFWAVSRANPGSFLIEEPTCFPQYYFTW